MKQERRWMQRVLEATTPDSAAEIGLKMPWSRGAVRAGFSASREQTMKAAVLAFPAPVQKKTSRRIGFGLTA